VCNLVDFFFSLEAKAIYDTTIIHLEEKKLLSVRIFPTVCSHIELSRRILSTISQFEIEMRQRSQQHEEIMTKINETILTAKMQHEKTMMRLKIELKKTS
jgi:hypothetical protein